MSNPIELQPAAKAPVIDLPIIDLLAHDDVARGWVAEFVPEPKVSAALKESVIIPDGTSVARRIGELLVELGFAWNRQAVAKIAHAGGGEFDFTFADGSIASLEASNAESACNTYAALQLLGQEVQFEFISQRQQIRRAVG